MATNSETLLSQNARKGRGDEPVTPELIGVAARGGRGGGISFGVGRSIIEQGAEGVDGTVVRNGQNQVPVLVSLFGPEREEMLRVRRHRRTFLSWN